MSGFMGLLADGVTDPISGGAGWVGAGLLGAVLAWLMFKYIPEQNQQTRDLINAHNTNVNNITDKFMADSRDNLNKFDAMIDKICVRHQEDKDAMVDLILREKATMIQDFKDSIKHRNA